MLNLFCSCLVPCENVTEYKYRHFKTDISELSALFTCQRLSHQVLNFIIVNSCLALDLNFVLTRVTPDWCRGNWLRITWYLYFEVHCLASKNLPHYMSDLLTWISIRNKPGATYTSNPFIEMRLSCRVERHPCYEILFGQVSLYTCMQSSGIFEMRWLDGCRNSACDL